MGAGCCKEEAIDFSSEIELSHFHLLRSVGKGAFGKVRVVQHKKTKEIYALKYINKAKCIRMRAVENIIQERRLLEEVEFSLICNLRYAFQDDENLFMVLDLMLGGDLRFHLERAGPMREDVVRFYIAELALALDALHAKKIIHRDLKPDNVLLDEHGHAHLTDFNIAVYFNPAKPLVSVAGSMAYMAPEVLTRTGYTDSVDWWSLGVVMFELLFGKRPFRGKSNELLTNSILRDPLPLPDNVQDLVSKPCLDVLAKLCERDIKKRLGCTPEGLDAFKRHAWFKGIDWDLLVKKEATPPFEPDSKRANFDATHELEELLMEDNPLKAKKRAQTGPDTELSVEMQMMEDRFIVYDFNKVKVKTKRSHSLSRTGSTTLSGSKSSGLLRSPGALSSKPSLLPSVTTTTMTMITTAHLGANGSTSPTTPSPISNGSGGLGQKMNLSSTTLESILKSTPSPSNRHSFGRIETHFQHPSISSTALARTPSGTGLDGITSPTKIYRPASPSDLVGQNRFNPDEDRLSIISIIDIPQYSTSASHSNVSQDDGSGTGHHLKDSGSDKKNSSIEQYKNCANEFLQAAPVLPTSSSFTSTSSALSSKRSSSLIHNSGSNNDLGGQSKSLSSGPLMPPVSPSSMSSSSSMTSVDQDRMRRGHNHHRDISSALSTPPTTHHSSPVAKKLEGNPMSGTVLFSSTLSHSRSQAHTDPKIIGKPAEMASSTVGGEGVGIKAATAVNGASALTVALHLA
ncbi:hypothetical protein BGZ83_007821 [Gryganskiella cystojenkinii]|nr:hypothetical protein BGZ83_007821 [Gryganskiella cystojenkinii]